MWLQKPRAIQFNGLDFLLATLAVVGCVAICELLFQFGVENAGALFWVPVLWAAKRCGLVIGLWAAVIACSAFYVTQMPPRYELGTDFVGFATLQAIMLVVAAAISTGPKPEQALVYVRSGDYASDCSQGARDGAEFLRVLQFGRKCFMLGWKVREMIEKGRYTGVEAGFFHSISTALLNDLPAPRQDTPDDLNGQGRIIQVDREVISNGSVRHE
jgi:hypothetical protein